MGGAGAGGGGVRFRPLPPSSSEFVHIGTLSICTSKRYSMGSTSIATRRSHFMYTNPIHGQLDSHQVDSPKNEQAGGQTQTIGGKKYLCRACRV